MFHLYTTRTGQPMRWCSLKEKTHTPVSLGPRGKRVLCLMALGGVPSQRRISAAGTPVTSIRCTSFLAITTMTFIQSARPSGEYIPCALFLLVASDRFTALLRRPGASSVRWRLGLLTVA